MEDEPIVPKDHRDPISRTFVEADDFNHVWFRKGVKQTGVQRLGFAIISALMGIGGGTFVSVGVELFKAGDVAGLYPLGFGCVAVFLGIMGLWKVGRDVFGK